MWVKSNVRDAVYEHLHMIKDVNVALSTRNDGGNRKIKYLRLYSFVLEKKKTWNDEMPWRWKMTFLLSFVVSKEREKDLVIKNSWLQIDLCWKEIQMSGHDFLSPSFILSNKGVVTPFEKLIFSRFISPDLFTVT